MEDKTCGESAVGFPTTVAICTIISIFWETDHLAKISNRSRKMTKRSCEYCKYLTDGCRCKARDERITSSIWFERGCPHFEEFKQTVFDKITASEEALAEKLVYEELITEEDDGYVYRWRSTILPNDFWYNEEKAIAATVEELKKEAR